MSKAQQWLDKNYPSYTDGAMSREAVVRLLEEYNQQSKLNLDECLDIANKVNEVHLICGRLCLAVAVATAIWVTTHDR